MVSSASSRPPFAQRDERPDAFHDAERPRALYEPVGRTEHTKERERQREPAATLLQGIGDQHARDGEQSEGGEECHRSSGT